MIYVCLRLWGLRAAAWLARDELARDELARDDAWNNDMLNAGNPPYMLALNSLRAEVDRMYQYTQVRRLHIRQLAC